MLGVKPDQFVTYMELLVNSDRLSKKLEISTNTMGKRCDTNVVSEETDLYEFPYRRPIEKCATMAIDGSFDPKKQHDSVVRMYENQGYIDIGTGPKSAYNNPLAGLPPEQQHKLLQIKYQRERNK